jgi:hypothetical protein
MLIEGWICLLDGDKPVSRVMPCILEGIGEELYANLADINFPSFEGTVDGYRVICDLGIVDGKLVETKQIKKTDETRFRRAELTVINPEDDEDDDEIDGSEYT